MLHNINSTYILKIIFSYQIEKNKFKFIKYSKSLKNKLDINLIDYRRFSGRYIIYEKEKGKIKEYNSINDQLIFEGEYSNGKKEGKGKEYYYDEKISNEFQTIFEGEYKEGKRNGKGKEYYINCNGYERIIFEGEYLNGKRNGKGKEFYDNGKLKFEGEYLNGNQIHGIRHDPEDKIYEYYGNGYIKDYDQYGLLIFEGEYLNGFKNGKGKEYFHSDKLKFEGEYLNGLRNGKGMEFNQDGELLFKGEYFNDKMWNGKSDNKNNNISYEFKNGKGFVKRFTEYNGKIATIFEAEYLNGKMNGKVKDFSIFFNFEFQGDFKGEYKNNQKQGEGKLYKGENELIFEGEYIYNQKLRGKAYIDNHLEFEGEYLCDKKWDGKGYDKNGNISYELNKGTGKVQEYNIYGFLIFSGEYLNGFRNGKGKEYINGELIFEGEYLNGLRNGKGKEYDNDRLIFEGEYLNGLRNGIGKEYEYDYRYDEVLFEGEYFEGKRWNGYEKKYYISGDFVRHLEFEGQIINGKRGENLKDKKA